MALFRSQKHKVTLGAHVGLIRDHDNRNVRTDCPAREIHYNLKFKFTMHTKVRNQIEIDCLQDARSELYSDMYLCIMNKNTHKKTNESK